MIGYTGDTIKKKYYEEPFHKNDANRGTKCMLQL